jgi:hypothetical protein
MSKTNDFSFNSCSNFVMSHLVGFFVTPGKSHPLTSMSGEQAGKGKEPIVGLYVHYSSFMSEIGASSDDSMQQREFQNNLNELWGSVFFLPSEPATGLHCFTGRVSGYPAVDRCMLYNTTFYPDGPSREVAIKEGLTQLEPHIPVRIAALAFLHPTASDDYIKQDQYSPALSVKTGALTSTN